MGGREKMGEKKTVIFSSHIMQEVQALCDRIVIINEGKLTEKFNLNKQYIDGVRDQLKNVKKLPPKTIKSFQNLFGVHRKFMNEFTKEIPLQIFPLF